MCGRPTSPTSRWPAAFCIWWRSSTGRAARCWPGGCRTRWTAHSASMPWRRRCDDTANRGYQRNAERIVATTPIKARNSPVRRSPESWEAAGIAISMDGRGRFMNNIFIERLWRSIKYEEVHLKAYADGREARAGIGSWMTFYNFRRPHQAMNNQMPMAVWRGGMDKIEAAARAVDMPLRLDNANALPTYPQLRQKQKEAA